MNDSAKIGLAIAGGYILGRTKKGKAALSLALWVASSRLGVRPGQLARQGLTKLATTPQVAALGSQLRGPVMEAGRRAAVATLESRMERFADSLQERTSSLGGQLSDTSSSVRGRDDEADDEADEERPARKSTSKRSSSSTRGSTSKSSSSTGKRTSAARKPASRGNGSGRTSSRRASSGRTSSRASR